MLEMGPGAFEMRVAGAVFGAGVEETGGQQDGERGQADAGFHPCDRRPAALAGQGLIGGVRRHAAHANGALFRIRFWISTKDERGK